MGCGTQIETEGSPSCNMLWEFCILPIKWIIQFDPLSNNVLQYPVVQETRHLDHYTLNMTTWCLYKVKVSDNNFFTDICHIPTPLTSRSTKYPQTSIVMHLAVSCFWDLSSLMLRHTIKKFHLPIHRLFDIVFPFPFQSLVPLIHNTISTSVGKGA